MMRETKKEHADRVPHRDIKADRFGSAQGGARDSAYRTGSLHGPPLDGLPAVARALYLFGLKRTRCFPGNLAGEPVWHILLELYASEAEGQTMSLTGASAVSGATETTGLRTVRLLERTGFVRRNKADGDARRFELRLTAIGRNAVEQALNQMLPTVGPALARLAG